MLQEEHWRVVIGQKGSIVLPDDVSPISGVYLRYALSLRHVFSDTGRIPKVYLEMDPRFVDQTEQPMVTTRRRIYIGRALSVLGFDKERLRHVPRAVRTVDLLRVQVPHKGMLYRLDLTDMVAWGRKHSQVETVAAVQQNIHTGGMIRRFFLASKRYLLAENDYQPAPTHEKVQEFLRRGP